MDFKTENIANVTGDLLFYTFAHLKRRGSKNLVITCRGTGMKFYKV